MESFTDKRFVTFVFLIILGSAGFLLSAGEKTDSYEDLFFYARALEQGGALEQAQTEYKRYIFMQDYSQGKHQTECFEALAELYAKSQRWDLAADTFQKAIASAAAYEEPEETIDLLRLKHIYSLKMQAQTQNTSVADNLMFFSYMNLPSFSPLVRKAAFCADMENAIIQNRWDYAQSQYNRAAAEFPQLFTKQETETINLAFLNIQGFKPKNQILAGYLSFFPGLGQLYAGDYRDSLNAFLLNGTIITASVWSIWTLDLWTFSLLEFPLLKQFMRGNIYNAQKDAYYYNLNRYENYSKPILDILNSR